MEGLTLTLTLTLNPTVKLGPAHSSHLRECVGQRVLASRLSRECEPDHHDSVPHEHGLVELDDLGHVGGDGLQPLLGQRRFD